jgi:hypothetical protein
MSRCGWRMDQGDKAALDCEGLGELQGSDHRGRQLHHGHPDVHEWAPHGQLHESAGLSGASSGEGPVTSSAV